MGVDWPQVLLPDTPPLEIIARGTLIYLGTFVLLRLIVRREVGGIGLSDLIVIVFIADAAQNGMSGGYDSVADGLLLVATLMFWAYAIDRLTFRYPAIERLFKPPPVQLVRNGERLRRNMRREFVTEDELQVALRAHGVGDISQVKSACVEPDGTISVIQRNNDGGGEHSESSRDTATK